MTKMAKLKVWTGPKSEWCTMDNNIIVLLDIDLLQKIFNQVFEDGWKECIHQYQGDAKIGDTNIMFMEIDGKTGWFRFTQLPAIKHPQYSTSVYQEPVQKEEPTPIKYTTQPKSSLSFISRLFRF